jgi:Lamin Tail Domain
MQKLNLVVAMVACGVLFAAPFARGATSNVVISQVYGGGGNAGATYTNDFVELFNRGGSAVDVSGWTIQYASSSSTSWQTTALQGSIAPGHRYLVQLGSTAAIGAALPTPDASDTTNLAASGGKVALVRDTTALGCGATAGSCASTSLLEDFVGYGSASDFEGASAAPALSSTTAAVRADGGCTDTNSNGADFDTATPSPRNSASPATTCTGSQSPGTTAAAGIAADVQPVLSIALEKPSISFGNVFAGQTPAAVSERVTVVDTNPAGYALTVHRTAFTPADLPLGIAASAGTALTAIPIAPLADLLLGTKTAATPPAGDIWATSVGFTTALPPVSAGHYTATVTFTVVGA